MKVYRLGAIAAIGLLAACGSGDDAEPAASNDDGTEAAAEEPAAEPAAEPADEPADEPAATTADDADDANDADDADDGAGSSSIASLDDIPQECRQIMGDFLREIEPMVQGIDWENATMADLEALGDSIDAPASDIDLEMEAAGCNDIDLAGGDDAGFELSIELARQEAPGVVGWLEFIRDASAGFDTSGEGTVDQAADAPETCDEALDAVRALMEQSDTMMELPVDEVMAAGNTISNITTVCSIDEMSALFEDPDFLAWTDG